MTRREAEKKIIDYYLQFPEEPYKTIAMAMWASETQVRGVMNMYYRDSSIVKPLYFCYSIGCPKYIGYLFDCYSEREVIINRNRHVENKENFTQNELNFLKINYNLL